MSLSPARQHRLRVQAEQAAREGGSVRHASVYDLMMLQLAEDRRRLKGVQSTVKKKRKSGGSCGRNIPPGRGAVWVPGALNRMTCGCA